MKRSPHNITVPLWGLLLALGSWPLSASAQDQRSLSSTLDSLLNIPVSTASKFAQTSREAAASVTVITSEEIRVQGFRTLTEVLETVPGFYATDNGTHEAIGVRAFGPLSADNNRVLILLDGHSLNENFLDGARVGTALGMDLSIIERVEIVRGPGSALYGSNAMLAVVNVITRSGRAIDGVEVGTEVGTAGLRKGSFVMGTELETGLEVSLSGTWFDREGPDLYFPEWDSPLTNNGVADGADWDRGKGLLGSAAFGSWSLAGFFSDRVKGNPAAPFGSDFSSPDAETSDQRAFAELVFDRDVAPDKNLRLRSYYDEADFGVAYPYAAAEDVLGGTSGQWFGAEGHFRWDLTPAYRITLGSELRRNSKARIWGASPVLGITRGNFRSTLSSGFGQADLQIHERLQLTLGARLDHYSTVGTAFSPRGGLVFYASPGTTLKALYGEAFRAPNKTELNVEALPFLRRNPDVQPEEIRTIEIVWEQRVSTSVYATLAAYDYKMDRLISAIVDGGGTISFANAASGSVRGLEASLDARPIPGISFRAGYSLQTPREEDVDQFVNSPRHSLRASLTSSTHSLAQLGLRTSYESGRSGDLGRSPTDPVVVTDATLTSGFERVTISAIVENVFGVAYGHPAAGYHLQAEQPQEGRSFRLRVTLSF